MNYKYFENLYSSFLGRRDCMEHDITLALQYYHELLKVRTDNSIKGDFVNRGLSMCCANPRNGILITGMVIQRIPFFTLSRKQCLFLSVGVIHIGVINMIS